MGTPGGLRAPRAGPGALIFGTVLGVIIAGAPGLAAQASTEVHRWVDDDGVVHFSDEAPGDSRSERIEIQEPMGAIPLENAREILDRPIRRPGEDPAQAEEDTAEADGEADDADDDAPEYTVEDVPVPVEMVDF